MGKNGFETLLRLCFLIVNVHVWGCKLGCELCLEEGEGIWGGSDRLWEITLVFWESVQLHSGTVDLRGLLRRHSTSFPGVELEEKISGSH